MIEATTYTPERPRPLVRPPIREYRCKQCKRVLFEAERVVNLKKNCKCGKVNHYND